jgi:hypothetical protein
LFVVFWFYFFIYLLSIWLIIIYIRLRPNHNFHWKKPEKTPISLGTIKKTPKAKNNTKLSPKLKNKTKKTPKLLFNRGTTTQKHYKTSKQGLNKPKTKNTAPQKHCSSGNKGVGGS